MLLEKLTLNIHLFQVYVYEINTYLHLCRIYKYMSCYVHTNGIDLTVRIIAPTGRN